MFKKKWPTKMNVIRRLCDLVIEHLTRDQDPCSPYQQLLKHEVRAEDTFFPEDFDGDLEDSLRLHEHDSVVEGMLDMSDEIAHAMREWLLYGKHHLPSYKPPLEIVINSQQLHDAVRNLAAELLPEG